MNRKLLTSMILSLLIGSGVGYSVSLSQISMLNSKTSNLQSEISELTTDYKNLNNSYNEREELYKLLDQIYRQRDADCTNLTTFYNELQAVCNELEEEIDKLYSTISELEQMVNYEVHVLADGEYYQSIINDLQNANETILVAMYSIIYDPDDSFDWANDLIRELVYADQRGVNVTVVIEYRTYWGYMDDNLEAHDYLRANSVDVRLDNETSTDHMKLVIIDDKIVFVGSHNWSESALYYDYETSVRIVSENVAGIFEEYLDTTFGF